ncbi:MAG: MFS transporter, partial [Rhodospirillaceae bacterium]
MSEDPRTLMAQAPMRPMQVAAVAICIFLNAIDGFDVLAISFASPGIAKEWGIDRAALGLVLSMELIGMAVGSVVLGTLADRRGRRPVLLGCLFVVASGMWLATIAPDVAALSACRLFTGFGIGGILASINAMAAEFSNARSKSLAVCLMGAGYPAGAVVGGTIASILLKSGEWRDGFVFGSIVTATLIPLVWLLLPESIEHLMQRKTPDALARTNAALARLGHQSVAALPPPTRKASLATLFSPDLAHTTILLTAGYFMHVMTFYSLIKWIPKIIADMGFPASVAGGVLVWANVGGLSGSLLFSLLSYRIALKPLLVGTMLFSAILVTLFGQLQSSIAQISLGAAAAGFFTNAGIVGIYALIEQSFHAAVRAGA